MNVSSMVDYYEWALDQGDPRIRNWAMMDTPMKTIGFLIGYLILLHLIKEHMANKKPFELRGFLILYNFVQVIGSFYVFLEILIVAYKSNYSLVCQPVDYSNDPLSVRVSNF